jgi:sugar transferase EpsL
MWKKIGKRWLDIALCLLAAPILVPVIATLALLIKVRMGEPVLFSQPRTGMHGQPFTLWKFRSMTHECDAEGNLLPDTARLTKLGRFLRGSSLDELPTLWNVLRGNMSLVGPRPLLLQYLKRYNQGQMRRHEVLPGITGWAQVNGRNSISWEEKFRLDVWYVDHMCFGLDMKILLMSVKKILIRDGISHPGEATMHEFMGSPSSPNNQSVHL